jgi:hypothetical protein
MRIEKQEVNKVMAEKKRDGYRRRSAPGALRKASEPRKESRSRQKLSAATKKPGVTGQRARLAKTLKSFH